MRLTLANIHMYSVHTKLRVCIMYACTCSCVPEFLLRQIIFGSSTFSWVMFYIASSCLWLFLLTLLCSIIGTIVPLFG